MPARASEPLRVQLLGPVRAWRGNDEIDLGSPRRRSVFAILALHANQVVSREELVDGLWGDDPPAKAVGVLYTYVSGLRRVLEPASGRRGSNAVLVSVDSGYSLRLAVDELDEQQFDRQLAAAQRQWESGDLSTASDALDNALSLWHGEPLAGLTGPLVDLHRARLGELRLSALEWRSELRLAVGDPEGAIADLADMVRDHPLRERPRALLMVALYRSGRRADALDVFSAAEGMLATELGIEPGRMLQLIHQRILADEPLSAADMDMRVTARQATPVPAAVSRALPGDTTVPAAPPFFVGRERELGQLRATLTGLARGRGGCVWVEGEPGIGRSALLATALASVDTTGYRVVWTTGDELVRSLAPGDDADAVDPRTATVDRLLQHITRTTERFPLVLAVDDVQWADATGLLAWSRAARRTRRLPFVLLGACRTVPRVEELDQPRNAVAAAGGRIVSLRPLSSGETVEFAARGVDAPPGPALSEFLGAAAGNPAAIRALLDSLVRADALRRDAGVVDLDPESSFDRWDALTTVVLRRLDVLSADTKDVLHWAALLGTEFDLGDVAVVMHANPTDLVHAIDEATAADILEDAEGRLAFRDPAVRKALYEQRSLAVRTALHREAAEALASAGVPVERVAGQLLAATPTYDAWTVRWLLDNIDAVAARDPVIAVDLLEDATSSESIGDEDRDAIAVRRVRWLFRLGRGPDVEARAVLATTRNAEYAAEMRYVLARLTYHGGDAAAAIAGLRRAEQNPSLPDFWKDRYRTLRARFERTGLDDLDAAARTAMTVLDQQPSVTDPKATAYALQELWYIATVHRDHTTALAHIDRALAALATAAHDRLLAVWQLDLLDNRIFTLQNLDRLADASETLARMRLLATRLPRQTGRTHVVAAVHHYWLGRWDDALAELGQVAEDGPEAKYFDLRIQAPLLQHGVAALIAARRGDRDGLRAHLDAGRAYPLTGPGEQENSDFLVIAGAIDAGRRANGHAALLAMDPLVDPNYGRMTLRHQWLPDLVGLALDVGDHERAHAALASCRQEAARETPPARAHAALARCQALVDGDPGPLLATAAYYDRIGRRVEMATTLADAAVLLARRDEVEQAQRTLDDAVRIFGELGAVFDIGQVEARLRRYDREGVITVGHQQTAAGRGSLSGVERLIAELVAAGRTNVDIASELGLSRRTVQSHLSRIMQRLGARSRTEVAAMLSETPSVPGGQHTVPGSGNGMAD